MPIIFTQAAVVESPGQQTSLGNLLSVTPGNLPEYLAVTGLDRNEYTAASTGSQLTLSGNGNIDHFQALYADVSELGLIFTYTSNGYYNPTYGYLDQMTVTGSSDAGHSGYLSFYGFGTAGQSDASQLAALQALITPSAASHDPTYAFFATPPAGETTIGSLDFVTRGGASGPLSTSATPSAVVAAAESFVGKTWNIDGCWVLCSNVAALAGASLPVSSTSNYAPSIANGEWIVAYNAATATAAEQADWMAQLRPGDMVGFTYNQGGHITTVVSGSGNGALVVDNSGYYSGDGSPKDVVIGPASPFLDEITNTGFDPKSVIIYRLDTPVINSVDGLSVLPGAGVALGGVIGAQDPGGRTIQSFQAYVSGGGVLQLGGAAESGAVNASGALTLAPSDLASLSFLAGSATGQAVVEVRAFNGNYWGDWQPITVQIGKPSDIPTLEPLTPQTELRVGAQIQLASLVAASSGASIASYTITVSDASINGGGYLVLNGATDLLSQTPDSNGGCTYKVSAADFSKVTYVAAGNHENEMTLTVSATSSGGLTSAPVNLAIEDGGFAGNRICHFLAEGTTLPLSQTVCLSEDRGGGPISSFLVSIPQSSNDVIHLNGAVNQLKNGAYNGYYEYQVSAADFNKMTITVGKSTGNLADDSLIFNIESNHYNSCPNPIVTAATAPSILLDNKAALAIGESVSFNSLLHYSSTPDLSKALFHIYDPTGGGQISLNGAANGELANVPNSDALPGEYTVSGSDLSKLTYTAGAGEESLLVSVSFDQGASWTSEVALTMSGTGGNPTIAQALQTPAAGPVAISDSAANFLANLDSVEALVADGKVLSVNLTDPGVPTLSLSAVELTQDARAIETVLGNVILSVPGISPDAAKFVVQQDAAAGAPLLMPGIASKGGVSVIGLSDLPNPGGTNLGGGYNVLVLDQAESDYTVTASHGSLTILDNYQYFVGQHTPPASYEVSGVSQIVFNGSGLGDAGQAAQTLFVLTPAQAQIASLYLAVLGRLPDSAGLAYYEAAQSANPSLSLSDLAQGFLSSAEYGANPAHSYAPSPAGDAQFITDIYSNLLHRAPAQGDVTWYQTNAINPMLSGLTPGTAAYAAAELKAHATVLVYVSHSPEFLADVQVTAQTPPDAQHWLLLA